VENGIDGFQPSVFYNIVCRGTSIPLFGMEINNSVRFPLGKNSVKGMRPEMLQAIGEAEFHRAPLVAKGVHKLTPLNTPINSEAFLNRNYIEGLPSTYTRKYKLKLINDAIETYRGDIIHLLSSKDTRTFSEKKQVTEYLMKTIRELQTLRNILEPRLGKYTLKISNKEREQMRIQRESHRNNNVVNNTGFNARAAEAEAAARLAVEKWRPSALMVKARKTRRSR
jgi:hypothetical protein